MAEALARRVGLFGAIGLGLGSIVGTGVFVSLGLAADTAGAGILPALLLAALVALLNGLSSAQLAAAFPVSGGTYEYAHRTIGPAAGFTAGFLFLAAKSASAATAALGLAGYAATALGWEGRGPRTLVAVVTVALVTALVHQGARRTTAVNLVLVALTVGVLTALVALSAPSVLAAPDRLAWTPTLAGLPGVLEGAALLFVAYTGYGRIATLGEEVVDPRATIPRAVVGALVVVTLLYAAVGAAALGVLGADGFAAETRATAAPLQAVARALGHGWLAPLVTLAAATAMGGVLLNLVLGLSRVVLAMARRGDAPAVLARVDATGTSPGPAVLATGAAIGLLVLVGDVKATWSVSAFTVLVYYALTNLSALRLDRPHRLYPRWTAAFGLVGCLSLAVFVDAWVWLVGAVAVAVAHAMRRVFRRI